MSISFATNQSVYANIAPVADYPFRVTIPFRIESNPGANQSLFYIGDKDSTSVYAEITIASDGTVKARDRTVSSSYATTANTVNLGATNIITVIFDEGGGGGTPTRIRIKLNGGPVATLQAATAPNCSAWDRIAFGGVMRSGPIQYLTGLIEQPFLDLDSDDFADHDAVWNSGVPVSPGTGSLGASRWPFDVTTGSVAGTDVAIDDVPGTNDLDTVGGTPSYATSLFSSAATAYTLTGPVGDLTRNTESGDFTVEPNGDADGDIVVTPSDGGAGGVFNPTSVTFSDGDDSAKTFKYTPRAAGGASVTISCTNDGDLTDPADVTKDVNVVLTQFRITGTPTLIVPSSADYVIDTEQSGSIS